VFVDLADQLSELKELKAANDFDMAPS